MEPDRVFGDVADRYDRRRPDYPAAVVDAVLAAAPEPWRVLECGAGTGKATRLLAARGVPITATEPDPRMADRLREHCAASDVEVVVSRFEDVEVEPGAFTIGLAAQSWHWVDPERGSAVMARALAPGGVLALTWNGAAEDGRPIRLAIEAVYARHAPELVEGSVVNRRLSRDAGSGLLGDPSWFGAPEQHVFPWVQRYTTDEYLELLGTHSDHVSLPADVRDALLDEIRTVLDDDGGQLDYRYETELVLFRRR